jgi:hypothetical protein
MDSKRMNAGEQPLQFQKARPDQERETLPVTSDKKGALSIARRRTR